MKLSDYKIPSTKNINLKDYQTSEGKKEDNDYIKENIIPPLVEKLKKLHLRLHAEGKKVLWSCSRQLMLQVKTKQFLISFQT